ncbi:MAG TPA: hypothetical protein VGF84_23320 [Micromonosporaceae bacterium]
MCTVELVRIASVKSSTEDEPMLRMRSVAGTVHRPLRTIFEPVADSSTGPVGGAGAIGPDGRSARYGSTSPNVRASRTPAIRSSNSLSVSLPSPTAVCSRDTTRSRSASLIRSDSRGTSSLLIPKL